MRSMQDGENLWAEFAGRVGGLVASAETGEFIAGKTLLITGAGGSIGSALTRFAASHQPESLILLDSSEHGLYALEQCLDELSPVQHVPVLGSICDPALLSEVFSQYRPHIVLHAAACKHVPLMERNPLASASVNILGTQSLLQAAAAHGVADFVMVSTDKAVLPVSIMGATKRLAELLLFTPGHGGMRRKAVRLGNVLGSSGSVGPIFHRQIREGGPVTVTHPRARRFFLTLADAVALLSASLSPRYASGILVPDLGHPRRVEDLARYLMAATAGEKDIEIVFTGLRAGDKMEEFLLSPAENAIASRQGLFSSVTPEAGAMRNVPSAADEVCQSVRRRDPQLLVEGIGRVLPEYRPSQVLQQIIEGSPRAALQK